MRLLRWACVGILLVASIAEGPARGLAQIVDVPSFTVTPAPDSATVQDIAVAAGLADAMYYVWIEASALDDTWPVFGRLVSSTGTSLGPRVLLEGAGKARGARVVADTRGGYLGVWTLSTPDQLLRGRLVTAGGSPATGVLALSPSPQPYGYAAAAGLPTGAVVAWRSASGVSAQLLAVEGAAVGGEITVRATALHADPHVRVVALADGGFLVGWFEPSGSWARRFDAAGTALGDPVQLATEFASSDLAASPVGGFVVVGSRDAGTRSLPAAIWARRFDAAGVPAGPSFVVALLEPEVFGSAAAEIDADGRLYVGWTRTGLGVHHPSVRIYAADGRPLGAPFDVTDDATFGSFTMAIRPDRRLVSAWRAGSDLRSNVLAPCVPPFHTGCGDGVVQAPCEGCDQGAANSDTAPDACRTICRPPACGDGVVDAGEQCDDGNLRGCDGCDATCTLEIGYQCGDGIVLAECDEQCDDGAANSDTTPDACRTACRLPACADGVVDADEQCDDGNRTPCDGCSDLCVAEPGLTCGDGIAEVGCGEQCDDGNAIVGDGCLESCRLEIVPGGGTRSEDCRTAWSVDNPSNVPRYDKAGFVSGVQQCRDGDPACDFDGAVNASCTFHARVCANVSAVSGCYAGLRLRSWTLTVPSEGKAAKVPALAAVRAAFAGVPGVVVGPEQADRCTDTLEVVVPMRTGAAGARPTRLTLKSRAETYRGDVDGDKLRLVCVP